MKCHVDYMLSKVRKKLWTLRHVKAAGLCQSDLLKIYQTVIRPTLEYAVPTYHPMLTKEMCEEIESVQRRACKLIFGWDSNYDKLLEDKKIESLHDRREKMTLSFARKTLKNPRFASWFPQRNYGDLNLRKEKKFDELFARTERLKKSPLFYMRRALNASE